jgi:hypothetical protein
MIEVLKFKNKNYPLFQTKGFASKYCFPFANEVCVGIGYDIGCMKKEWAFPGAIPIDLTFDNGYHATNLPDGALDYWGTKLKKGGVIFLYLPDYSQEYWRPWNNKKHINILTPEYLKNYFEDKNFEKVFVSGVDLNNSFIVMVEK